MNMLVHSLPEEVLNPVELVSLFDSSGREITGRKGVRPVGSDASDVLSVVSDSYSLYQNQELITDLQSSLEGLNVKAEVVEHLYTPTGSLSLRVAFPEFVIEGPDKTKMQVEALVQNSYDSTSSLMMKMGVFRFVCLNMMVVGRKDLVVRTPHTRLLSDRTTAMFQMLGGILEQGPARLEKEVNALSVKVSDPKSLLLETLHRAGIPKVFATHIPDTRNESLTQSAWGAYSVLSDTLTHAGKSNLTTRLQYMSKARSVFYDLLTEEVSGEGVMYSYQG